MLVFIALCNALLLTETLQVWWKWQGRNDTRIHDLEGAGNETQAEPATGYVVS